MLGNLFGKKKVKDEFGVRALMESWPSLFMSSDDEAWNAWVKVERREWRDLVALVKRDDVRESLQARALLLLLAPSTKIIPFQWKDDHGLGPNAQFPKANEVIELSKDSERLRAFTIDALLTFMRTVKGWEEDWALSSVNVYARLVRAMLPHLPENDPTSQRLVDAYDLNDAKPFYGFDESSGYNPFQYLMWDENIPDVWKARADARMRDIVVREVRGEAQPRAKHEDALKCYVHNLSFCMARETGTYKDEASYAEGLMVDQIRFILGLNVMGRGLIWSGNLEKFLNTLRNDIDLRRQLIVFAFTRDGMEFKVYDANSMELANSMLRDMAGFNDEVTNMLEGIIAKGEKRIEEDAIITRKKREAKQAVEDLMR